MMALSAFGSNQLAVLVMLFGCLGLPLGVPPQPENPAMQHVAPAKCVLYATWTSMATPNAQSENQTEQLFAEPEIQEFAKALEKYISQAIEQQAKQTRDPKAELAARLAPRAIKTLLTRSSAVFASRIEMQNDGPIIEGGLLVDAGAESKGLADGLVQLLTTPSTMPTEVTIGTQKYSRFVSPMGAPIQTELTLGLAGQYVVIGIGKGSIEGMIERLRAKQVPAWLTTLQKRLPVERRASMSYVNIKALVDTFLPSAGPEAARIGDALGLNQFSEMNLVMGLDKEGMVSRTLLRIDGPHKGLLVPVSGAGIKPEQVNFIPKDATFATALSFSALRLYDWAQKRVAEKAPPDVAGDFNGLAAQFQQMFGLRLREDLLASLGDVWTLSSSPADGIFGFTATVEVRDRAKFAAMLQKTEAMLAGLPPDEPAPRIETSKFGQFEIKMLAIPGVPVRPSWSLVGSRAIVGISPQAVKTALAPRPNEIGLFNSPQFAAAFKQPGETIAISYQDSAKLFEAAYGYVTLFAPMIAEAQHQASSQPGAMAAPFFDVATIPSARSIHRHLRPGISITRRTADGIESESRNTVPTPSVATSAPVLVAILLPAVQQARAAALRAQSASNLRQLAIAMNTHETTHGSYPPQYSLSKEGKPLLSWRVHLLPLLDEQALYEQFHLDEPWDSEHNKKLIAKMPPVYRSTTNPPASGKTAYLGISGPKGIFAPPKLPNNGKTGGVTVSQVTDGLSLTIMLVEASNANAVEWTKPEDYVPDEKAPTKGLLGRHPNIFQAVRCDVLTLSFQNSIEPSVLMSLFQINDRKIIRPTE